MLIQIDAFKDSYMKSLQCMLAKRVRSTVIIIFQLIAVVYYDYYSDHNERLIRH